MRKKHSNRSYLCETERYNIVVLLSAQFHEKSISNENRFPLQWHGMKFHVSVKIQPN